MNELEWSLLLDGIGLIPITLQRFKRRSAWLWQIFLMGLWIVYAFDKGGYGFIPGALIYSVFYVGNYRKWKRDDQEAVSASGVLLGAPVPDLAATNGARALSYRTRLSRLVRRDTPCR